MKKLLLSICCVLAMSLTAQTVNLSSPSNGSTVNGIDTALFWYDVSGETGYVVQVDTVNTFDSANLQSETTTSFNTSSPIGFSVGNLAFGTTYYWRVAILNGDSQAPWSEVRNFITIGQPNLYLPANGDTFNGVQGTLQWYDISGETGFVFQVDTVNTFDSANLQTNTIGAFNTSSPIIVGIGNLNFGTTYYWRVAFLNETEQSNWSATRTFTTIGQPNLSAPSNGETVNINPILQWYDVSGESGYVYQLDTVNTFDSPNLQTVSLGAFTENSNILNVGVGILPFGTTYYWRVAILNATSQSNWSAIRNFTTIGQPSLYSPVNGETINGILAILQWYDYSGETGYAYQVDTANTFDSPNLQSSTAGAQTSFGFPSIGVGSLAFGTTYYWRVAILSAAGQSDWSAIRSFTTVTKPNLDFPYNGMVNTGSSVNLSWYNIAGETGFAYQLDTNQNFNSANLQSGTIGAYTSTIGFPAIGFNSLLPDTTYFWRIAFLNGTSQSEWSNTWIFSTGDTILGTAGQEKQRFLIYPNPASESVYISGNNEKIDFKIISADGKQQSFGSIQTNQAIDISGLATGIYFLKITTGDASGIYKILKQ